MYPKPTANCLPYTNSDSFTRHYSIVGIGDTMTYKIFDAHKKYAMRIRRHLACTPELNRLLIIIATLRFSRALTLLISPSIVNIDSYSQL